MLYVDWSHLKKKNAGKKNRERVWVPGGPEGETDRYGSYATITDLSELCHLR